MEETFVVQFNETSELFLREYDPNQEVVNWGPLEQAIEYRTLAEAQAIAGDIGGGTVGTPKPQA